MVDKVMLALASTGLVRCWPQATGAAFRDGQLIHFGVVGGGDISGITVGGKRLEVEVKTGKATLKRHQRNFGKMITAHGGIYILARSPEEAVSQLLLALYTSQPSTLLKTS